MSFTVVALFFCILDRGASAQGGSYGNNSNSDLSDSDEIVIDFDKLQFRVYQGDITQANVDVIVNSTNPEFDLNRGKNKPFDLRRGNKSIIAYADTFLIKIYFE